MSSVNPRSRRVTLRIAVEGAILATTFTAAMTVLVDVADWPHSPALLGALFSAVSWQGVFAILGHDRAVLRMRRQHSESRRKTTTEIEDQMQALTAQVRDDLRRLNEEIRRELQSMKTLNTRSNVWAQAFSESECPPPRTGEVTHLRSVEP